MEKQMYTSLSSGAILREMLLGNAAIRGKVTAIFPLYKDDAKLPYIAYRRSSSAHQPTKCAGVADAVHFEIYCFTSDYASGLDLAESVRAALDGVTGRNDTFYVRSCRLVNSSEDWLDDAYIQKLEFEIRV